jgi:ribonuclease PH
MDINLARHVIRSAFRSARELEDLMQMLKINISVEEYKDYALGIAAAIDGINVALLDKVLASHPELKDELKASMAKYDCYL